MPLYIQHAELPNVVRTTERLDADSLLRGEELEIFPASRFSFLDSEVVIPDRDLLPQIYFWAPRDLLPVRVRTVPNVAYSRLGHIAVGGQPLQLDNAYTETVQNDVRQALANNQIPSNAPYIDRAFLLVHTNFTTYGHFLMEMLPKLLIYKLLLECLPDLPILVPPNSPSFVRLWIDYFCPNAEIATFPDESSFTVNIGQAFVSDMLITHYVPSPLMRAFIDECVRLADQSILEKSRKGIYVSRKSRREERGDFRFLENSQEIENLAVELGLDLFEPEQLNLAQQISLFRGTPIIAGELCSGLHNALFSPPNTGIVQINPFNFVQRQIGLFNKHRMVSILPSDGILRAWPGKREVGAAFTVAPPDLRRAISLLDQDCQA